MDINTESKARIAKLAALMGALGGFHLADMAGKPDMLFTGFLMGAVIGYAAPFVQVETGFGVIVIGAGLVLKNCSETPGGMRPDPFIDTAPGAPSYQRPVPSITPDLRRKKEGEPITTKKSQSADPSQPTKQ